MASTPLVETRCLYKSTSTLLQFGDPHPPQKRPHTPKRSGDHLYHVGAHNFPWLQCPKGDFPCERGTVRCRFSFIECLIKSVLGQAWLQLFPSTDANVLFWVWSSHPRRSSTILLVEQADDLQRYTRPGNSFLTTSLCSNRELQPPFTQLYFSTDSN